jgi:hypothetical protein
VGDKGRLKRSIRGLLNTAILLSALLVTFAGESKGQTPPAQPAPPQTPPPQPSTPAPQNQSDEDPTRAVFFSVREEYRNLKNGAWNNRLIIRKDEAIFKTGRGLKPRGLLLRADFPITSTRLGSDTRFGLGDLYGQALLVPYINRRFAFAGGTGLSIPTATDKTTGTGKWQIAPLAVPVWFLPRAKGFFLVKVQNFKSFAGPSSRADLNFLLVTPTLFYRPARRWWILADAESSTDWIRDKNTNYRVGFQVGRVLTPKFALAVKPEVPFGGRRAGDWTLKFIGTWYRE